MTKIDTSPIEEMHAHLVRENQRLTQGIALFRSANRILNMEIDRAREELAKVREVNEAHAEQIRKAQERIRAADAARDGAWNEAIEAAASWCDFRASALDEAHAQARARLTFRQAAAAIRSLTKPEPTE